MKLFAIGDLHLSGNQNKPMSKFGDHWDNHQFNIEKNWVNKITEKDIIAVPGDISWAMSLDEVSEDLHWLHTLPGTKIMLRGNHDYWWKKIKYLNSLYDNMIFLQNDSTLINNVHIAGSRGWLCPGSLYYKTADEKIYLRELQRLELSLKSCKLKPGQAIIVLMHFPPFNEKREHSGFMDLFKKYNVKRVIYGHLHDQKSFNNAIIGGWQGIEYSLVSADYINFNPLLIMKL